MKITNHFNILKDLRKWDYKLKLFSKQSSRKAMEIVEQGFGLLLKITKLELTKNSFRSKKLQWVLN